VVCPWTIARPSRPEPAPRETRVAVEGASLYARTVGRGDPIVVLHGGPDFDHAYLLPDLDRLKDSFHLVYYDQRGRGRSADGVRAEDVTLQSELEDLERVRRHFELEAPALLGHSWGAVLALEYALRHPTRVSRLILMNPAPASAADVAVLRKAYLEKLGAAHERQTRIRSGAAYQAGDPKAVAARYRIHFKPALKRAEDYERLMSAMEAQFVRQGSAGIRKARAVEDRLYRDTWEVPGYDLLPKLAALRIPTLVLTGDHDFIPAAVAERIARAIPGARLVSLEGCGHFTYLECPGGVREALRRFFRGWPPQPAAPSPAPEAPSPFAVALAYPEPAPGRRAVTVSPVSAPETLYVAADHVVTLADVEAVAFETGVYAEGHVEVRLKPEGRERLARATAGHVGGRMVILLRGFVHSAPIVQMPIEDGVFHLTGGGSSAELAELAARLDRALRR
jgi:proline iminopeptidase